MRVDASARKQAKHGRSLDGEEAKASINSSIRRQFLGFCSIVSQTSRNRLSVWVPQARGKSAYSQPLRFSLQLSAPIRATSRVARREVAKIGKIQAEARSLHGEFARLLCAGEAEKSARVLSNRVVRFAAASKGARVKQGAPTSAPRRANRLGAVQRDAHRAVQKVARTRPRGLRNDVPSGRKLAQSAARRLPQSVSSRLRRSAIADGEQIIGERRAF